MPFYGATPDEAAQQLTRWLARAATLSRPDRAADSGARK